MWLLNSIFQASGTTVLWILLAPVAVLIFVAVLWDLKTLPQTED